MIYFYIFWIDQTLLKLEELYSH